LFSFLQTCKFINNQKKYIYRLIFQRIIFNFNNYLPKIKNIIVMFNNNNILESYLYLCDVNINKVKLFKLLYEKIFKNTDNSNKKIEIIINSYKYLEDDLNSITTTCKSVQNYNLDLLINEYFKKRKLEDI